MAECVNSSAYGGLQAGREGAVLSHTTTLSAIQLPVLFSSPKVIQIHNQDSMGKSLIFFHLVFVSPLP